MKGNLVNGNMNYCKGKYFDVKYLPGVHSPVTEVLPDQLVQGAEGEVQPQGEATAVGDVDREAVVAQLVLVHLHHERTRHGSHLERGAENRKCAH